MDVSWEIMGEEAYQGQASQVLEMDSLPFIYSFLTYAGWVAKQRYEPLPTW